MYGVSRLTIRSAIQRLSTLGLLEIRIGEGSYVNEFSFSNILSEISELVAQDSMLIYFEEFRLYFENACTELAVKNITDEKIVQLSKQAQILKICADKKDSEQFIKEDYKFHYMLAIASNNKIFELIYSMIKDIFYKCISANINRIESTDINYLIDSADAHIRLVESIANRNIKKSSKLINAIASHFDQYNNKLNEE
jgi:GntR family transcriptional regulator, transcriptional repressor for pyruvate dehydrogenase complex